ncbi:MAG: DUF1697 domain-containing protein [Chloroflexota bacterium]
MTDTVMPPETYVALLRGINVGGKNRLPMEPLRRLFEGAGCDAVRTYIQSGNVVFEASPALASRVPELIEAGIEREFGHHVPLLLRSTAQMAAVIAQTPFDTDAIEAKWLHIGFLRARPADALAASLDPERSPPDHFELRGQEIYLWYPNGSARSKLTTTYFDRVLETSVTIRNWRTVSKLLEMMTSAPTV